MTNQDRESHDELFFSFWIQLADGWERGHDGVFMNLSDCAVME
jgi:hypothetical protein